MTQLTMGGAVTPDEEIKDLKAKLRQARHDTEVAQRELREYRQWQRHLLAMSSESKANDLIDKIAGGNETEEVTILRALVGEFWVAQAEHTALQDRHSIALKDRDEHDQAVRAACEENARRNARDYVTAALGDLLQPLRKLLTEASKINERTMPHELKAVARDASALETRLRNDPDPGVTEKMLADMKAAHSRLIREKGRLANTVTYFAYAVGMHQLKLVDLAEEIFRTPGRAGNPGGIMQTWRDLYDAHSDDWSETFKQAVASSLSKWEAT